MKNRFTVNRMRGAVQSFFFILVAIIVLAHSLAEAGITIPLISGASLHAICPFGGVLTLYELVTTGGFVQKIHESSVILSLLVILLAVFFGPVFCGWVCPFGTFQRWVSAVGRRVFKRRFGKTIPKKVDKLLRYLRYGVLVWVVIMTAVSARLIFADYDPYYALFNFWTGEVALTGLITLGVVIALSLVVERPFCRYACPYGALLGLTNFFRIFSIRRVSKSCINCKACDRACPMGIEVSTSGIVKDPQCISCMQCTSEAACPVEHTVDMEITYGAKQRTAAPKAAIQTKYLAIIILVVVFGGIYFTMLTGWWSTQGSKTPRRINDGIFAGAFDPADIRGSYSFGDIEENFLVPAEFIAQSYGFDSAKAEEFKTKDVEETFREALAGSTSELGTDSVRWLVSLYLGYPYEPEVSTILPKRGLELLFENTLISQPEYEMLIRDRSVDTTTLALPSAQVSSEVETPVDDGMILTIQGKSTFADILASGVPLDLIEEALGATVSSESDVIREVCEANDMEFSVFKGTLQKLIDTRMP